MPLHHKKQGQGDAVILIHGLFGSLENLGALAKGLAEHFCVYSIDLPNHGRSPHSEATNLKQMSDEVLEWMRQHKLDNVFVVGHSLGGKVAMEIALRHPDQIKKLVVMDIAPSAYPPHHSDVFEGLRAVDIHNITSRSEAEASMKPHVPEVAVRSFLLKNIVRESAGHFSWRMNLRALYEGYADLICANHESCFDAPVLFLKGGASDYISEKNRQDIESRFPEQSLKIVANTGHWLHAEKPAMVTRLINNFLAKE